MNFAQCCNILEVNDNLSTVTYQDLKAAHRIMVQVWHPDRFGHSEKLLARATTKMQLINEAWGWVEENFKSGAASAIKRQTQDETADYRTEISEALRGFYNRRFGFF